MPKLSICIPAYDMGGHGAQFLAESFERLKQQTFRDFEVIVSDQSKDEAVHDVCDAVEGFTVHHFWFREGPKQASANANNAMRHAEGEIVKILFQDDLLLGPDALETMMTGFEDLAVAWSVCGSGGTRDGRSVENPMIPSLHPYMHLGKNRISSPSVLAMRRSQAMNFDEQLIWLMDVDLYHRLLLAYGPPLIVPETLVLNRLHDGQVSAGVTSDLKRTELRYARQKFKEQETLKQRLFYYKQMLRG